MNELILNAAFLSDGYKTGHHSMEPDGLNLLISNWTPRTAKRAPKGVTKVVSFGQQMVIKYIVNIWNKNFFLLNEDEKAQAPKYFKVINAKGIKDPELKYFTIGVSPLDCVGCGNCAEICPAPGKALIMRPQQTQHNQIEPWNYATDKVKDKANPMKKATVSWSSWTMSTNIPCPRKSRKYARFSVAPLVLALALVPAALTRSGPPR